MTKQKRNRRTPEQIIAETEAKLERARTKLALEQAKSSPEVASVVEALDKVQKAMQESSKLLGNSPQSCNVRRQKHQLWIAEIDAAERAATIAQAAQTAARDNLQKLLADSVTTLSNDETVDAEDIAIQAGEILSELENNQSIQNAEAAVLAARNTRQSFGEEKSEKAEAAS